ncbi:polysaccharide deacetylase family protein [Clostridium sp. UBA3061]|uniref:polysaccharide deacetylase family protein n=1 Tax=Clostridium sp. UBA3061 TaxID=1946353 RepID=UPI003217FD0D
MKKLKYSSVVVLILICIFCTFNLALAEDNSKCTDKEYLKKIVYLTFDDGPTNNTLKILKILEEENVKATFFVIGELAKENSDILKQVEEQGHEICIHTYNHKNCIYSSKEEYLEDYNKANKAITDVLGHEPSKFMRMPGGSSTTIGDKGTVRAIRNELCDEGLYYVDWNISIEDALSTNVPVEKLLSTFKKELKKTFIDPNTAIVLMHDGASNSTTPKALPSIIKYFKDNDYEFKNFGDISEEELSHLLNQRQINKYNQPKQTDASN